MLRFPFYYFYWMLETILWFHINFHNLTIKLYIVYIWDILRFCVFLTLLSISILYYKYFFLHV